jgi:hypothetical protein
MTDKNETPEDKINKNLESLRQAFEPLTAGLVPDDEPAVVYLPRSMASVIKTNHDD